MAPVVSTIEIDRPPVDVFAYASDLVRFGEWQKDVVRLELHGAGPLGLGSRFTTTRQLGGVEYKTTQEVTEFSPPSRFAAASVGGRSGRSRSSRWTAAHGRGSPPPSTSRGEGSAGWCPTASAAWRQSGRPRATRTSRSCWSAMHRTPRAGLEQPGPGRPARPTATPGENSRASAAGENNPQGSGVVGWGRLHPSLIPRVYRWVQRFMPLLAEAARPCRHTVGDHWQVDATYVKVAGRWRDVSRAIDQA